MGFFDKLKEGLSKARDNFFGGIKTLFAGRTLDDEVLEELEEILIMSDMGYETANKILTELKIRYKKDEVEDPLILLRDIMTENLEKENFEENPNKKPYVIFVVGVNGSGKTTTIAKISKKYVSAGKSVVLAAADTFRAAAIEQLKHWGNKVGATVIAHEHGSDAAAVVYDSLAHAKAKNKDVVIIDTAGRLHTKSNLMEELKKIKRVIEKEIPGGSDETILVLDGTTGQNGIQQALAFKEAVDITSVVVTKLDGTAKGGIAFSINNQLNIPIKMIGVGEREDDLQMFEPKNYVNALLGVEE
ncbi:signal recognition particle-docking protein FtsY [Oceanotoga sp. DSM 15011]|jgi:fused signal recognition particle receptor|uniref:Signal recognition particle receptor FtsY n=1 Tax=Oceanotoga teriensis TaxID=515440 RepID=A0AA45HJI0_9BACT|nr:MULTISPECIES: signal recognition particle-docking protein FtsY [Oceanotoga]MDN5342384.1 fused signal recognition particle receptor [Oceanotoga sp.]MDO7975535.1 signal recognition particle-docking protein FtsY [Oceanotoga teriensis]PWJ96177.1 signal recognition particle-docking protein FtsY [Oceanotoga teriensis]UYO99960.1 signal recognition particle-docking protein FtsY [Oceanotoga sp. DSM 15011]